MFVCQVGLVGQSRLQDFGKPGTGGTARDLTCAGGGCDTRVSWIDMGWVLLILRIPDSYMSPTPLGQVLHASVSRMSIEHQHARNRQSIC